MYLFVILATFKNFSHFWTIDRRANYLSENYGQVRPKTIAFSSSCYCNYLIVTRVTNVTPVTLVYLQNKRNWKEICIIKYSNNRLKW